MSQSAVRAFPLVLALLAAAPAAVHAQLAPVGPRLTLVPLGETNFDHRPAVAAGPEGFVLAWTSPQPDPAPGGFATSISARRFDLQGRAAGAVVRADLPPEPFADGLRLEPTVAVGRDGGFVVAWHDVDDRDVHARGFGPRDRAQGPDFVVNTTRDFWQVLPKVAADPRGGYTVVWVNSDVGDQGPWPEGAFGQRLDLAGRKVGGEFPLDQTEAADRQVDVAIATNSERLVGWWSWLPELMVRRLARSGAPLTPELSASGHSEWHGTTSICALPGGRFLAAWEAPFPEEGIFARGIGADDTLGPIHRIDPPGDPPRGLPHLACDRFGGVLAVYVAFDGTVRARQLDLSGAPAGEEVVAGDWSHELLPPAPVAALGPGGRALVAWRSDGAAGTGVAGRVLQLGPAGCVPSDTDLCLHGGRFRVRAHWRIPNSRDAGLAGARPLLDDTGTLWFFGSDNLELAVKVLDGRAVNGRFWVFAGSLTTVEYWLEVFDTATAAARTYYNPPGSQAGIADAGAFAGTAAAAAVSPPARAPAAAFPPGPCDGSPATLCLGGRFTVEVAWDTGAATGAGTAVPLTADTGAFWFFGDQNVELLVKVIDGRAVNGHFWVLWGGLTTVDYTFKVTDLATGERKEYHHPAGSLLGGNDSAAF
jgi:hypothetical protein